jgi:hypothetical protein
VFAQAAILGFLFGELWYFGQSIGFAFNKYIQSSSRQDEALIVCGIMALIVSAYFYSREGYSDLKRLWQSRRVDLLALVALGLFVSVSVGGVGTSKYQEYIGKIDVLQLMLLVAAPVVIALMLILNAAIGRKRSDSATPFFISDRDIQSKDDDLLELSVRAARFAETVLNRGSSNSLVFGIDAPWGIGKSSFVNFCCEYWKDKPNSQIIVHRFEPLRYEDNADLAEKFVNDLVNTIQKHAFVPEIRPLFSKYSRLIKGKSNFSFLGMQFAFEPSPDTVEGTLESLEVLLGELGRKVIIVVDDLDRLSWSAIKNILFAIKRSFMLPNVSYVLCYDTENIASADKKTGDAEKVSEFFEKFVNIKISLFLDSSALAHYVSTNFERAVRSNLQIDPQTLDEIKKVIKELTTIFSSNEFFRYQDFLGDIRKLKRLINTMLLFEIEKTEFENSDFNKGDLIHLLLVYVNYPHIFRKIYNTEANEKNGFFSLVFSNIDSKFENSKSYVDYVKELTANQQFLLKKLFEDNVQDFSSSDSGIKEAAMMSRACFNGGGGSSRNLERYLNLIVKLSKPDELGYQFYVNKKDKLLQGKALDEIFDDEKFDFSKGDFSRDQLWRVIANSSNELTQELGSLVMSYLMEKLPEYSFLEGENVGVGSRKRLNYSLLKLLDKAAWGTSQAKHRNNNTKNISEIADWVFGEGSHASAGVVSTLAKSERGPLGLFDLMLFRLYCSADRGTSLFNLHKALLLHGDPDAPTDGPVTTIAKEEMREISQKVFQIFKSQYITPRKNLFDVIDNLTQDDFAGKCSAFVRAQIKSGEVRQNQIDELVAKNKSELKIFIIYQLGNSTIDSGVGCGFYDETGKDDKKEIAIRINDYLFDQCFNPTVSQENFQRFLDYLLMSVEWEDGLTYPPTLNKLTKVLEKDRLKKYWIAHKAEILALEFSSKKKRIFSSNYEHTYEDHLPAVYRVLDELLID